MTTVPNDLPPDAARYYREYVEAGGAEHAARAYALACDERDVYAEMALGMIADAGADGTKTQQMWAALKSRDAASATAEKLREALPAASADKPNAGAFFNDA